MWQPISGQCQRNVVGNRQACCSQNPNTVLIGEGASLRCTLIRGISTAVPSVPNNWQQPYLLSSFPLCLGVVEDDGAVLRAHIIPLPVQGRRVDLLQHRKA
jgi:hypothetical protein